MLFNSYEFILVFLPLVALGFHLLRRMDRFRASLVWLVGASLFFYGWWNPVYLLLLGTSIVANFALGQYLTTRAEGGPRLRKPALVAGVTANLASIGFFKYANFFVDNVNTVAGTDYHLETIVLPLAISFFTFQQITYLVDAYRGLTREHSFLNYCLFVTFFPQLIAGPIVHHSEMLPQFRERRLLGIDANDLAVGVTLFAIGLFKKAVLADGIAVYATPVFDSAETGASIDFFTAWGGALAYTFQLYFDFSGYCDMALGAARLFGIRLPVNFNSPYQATSIIEFWRRWHMTLSRFLRDYLYIPLGGNRHGVGRRQVNLMLTMLIGGLWHGAGWTFVAWGALHGIYLAINHAWRWFAARRGEAPEAVAWWKRRSAHLLTFLAVVVAWVFFRAHSFEGAVAILTGMVGANGIDLPAAIAYRVPGLAAQLEALGVTFSPGGGSRFISTWAWVVVLSAIAFLMPNALVLLRRAEPALNIDARSQLFSPLAGRPALRGLRWKFNLTHAALAGILFAGGLLALPQVSEFLYYQF